MGVARVERPLAAILAADVAGYSHLMGANEKGTSPPTVRALHQDCSDFSVLDCPRTGAAKLA